jgi:hypothetical protein
MLVVASARAFRAIVDDHKAILGGAEARDIIEKGKVEEVILD